MAEFDIRLVTRHDTVNNWESSLSIIKLGELAIAYAPDGLGYVPTELRLGVGKTWENTPTGLVPFVKINVTNGRNLDVPAQRGVNWNLPTLAQAMDAIFNPYIPPAIAINPNYLALVEAGDTFTSMGQSFAVSMFSALNIFKDGGIKNLYVDGGSARPLTDQSVDSLTQTVVKDIIVTSTVASVVQVISVSVKNSKVPAGQSPAFITAIANVEFRRRSGYFLWKNTDDLLLKTDAQITAIIKSITGPINGVRNSYIAGNGNKNFGQIVFNSDLVGSGDASYAGAGGYYNLYTYYPSDAGTVAYSTPGDEATPISGVTHKLFSYINGGATTGYKLSKLNNTNKIIGTTILNIN